MPVFRVSTKSKNGPRRTGLAARSIDEQQLKLAGLIEQAGDGRDDDAEARERAAEDMPTLMRYSAALRMASHSRSALASRGETSG